jgi:uncharacterized phiE125 gp8 family phage protein
MQLVQYLDNSEPLSLEDVKNHLRLDNDDDDGLLTNIIIPGARAHAEVLTKSVLRKAQVIYTIKDFPQIYKGIYPSIIVSAPNARSVDAINYTNDAGIVTPFTGFRSLIDVNQVKIINATWPKLTNPADDAVKITLTAGYTQQEFTSFLPTVAQWMLLAIGWAYTQRDLFANDARNFAGMPETYTNGLLFPATALPAF